MANLSANLKTMGDNVRPGQRLTDAITASRLNAIMDAIRALARGDNLIAGDGLRKAAVSEGVMLTAYGLGSASASTSHPFKVINRSTESAMKVEVRFGQVNSITPTINGTDLDADDTPTLTVVDGVVYLDVTVDGDGVAESVVVSSAVEIPEATATHGYITLASVAVEAGAVVTIYQSVTHSLGHQKCGATTHNFWGV